MKKTVITESFKSPRLLTEITALNTCLSYINAELIKPNKLYYGQNIYLAFPFTVYEFPLTWLYQCVIGSKIRPDTTTQTSVYTCQFFSRRNTFPKIKIPTDTGSNLGSTQPQKDMGIEYTTAQSQDDITVYVMRTAYSYTQNNVQKYFEDAIDKGNMCKIFF